jgi:hypothetical protein
VLLGVNFGLHPNDMKRLLPFARQTDRSVSLTNKRRSRRGRSRRVLRLSQLFLSKLPAAGKRRGINIQEVFDAFDRVPDAGATYTIQLCAALPVKGDPGASMNFSGGLKAGHTFLVVGKENGTARVSRSFGFYPAGRLSMWTPTRPHPSVIRDNRRHGVHARLVMRMTAVDFEAVRVLAITGAWNDYRLLSFNCAGYAGAIFNSVRGKPLVLSPYGVSWWGIPIGYNRLPSRRQMIIPDTPQGVYLAIRSLAMEGNPEALVNVSSIIRIA